MRILIVDDSLVYRTIIKQALQFPGVKTDSAGNGRVAIEMLKKDQYDLVTMDLEMPVMDGRQSCEEIRKFNKEIPIIVLSGTSSASASKTLDALSMGANDFIKKIEGSGDNQLDIQKLQKKLSPRIEALVKDKQTKLTEQKNDNKVQDFKKSTVSDVIPKIKIPEIITISSSTGGPETLRGIFNQIKPNITTPILLVQHMPPVFTTELAKMLDKICSLKVMEATHGQTLEKGHFYICPGNYHMELIKQGEQYKFALNQEEKECFVRPCANILLRSVAKNFDGTSLNFVLTGMGDDGADGSKSLKLAGQQVIIQDKDSSVVWGMPGAVFNSGHYDFILSSEDIIKLINEITL